MHLRSSDAAAVHPDQEYKYGIIEVDDLVQDLEQWTTLYCAGRLHKPVLFVERGENGTARPRDLEGEPGIELQRQDEWYSDSMYKRMPVKIAEAQRSNLRAALHTSMLLMPESFTLD